MPGPYRAILYKEVYYMNTFTLKGTFLDTPAPDTLRVREGYLLCENGLCAGFSETAPAGVEVLDYTGKIKLPASAGNISKMMTLDLKIGGSFTSPKVSVDTKSMANQAVEAVANEAISKLGEKLGLDSATTANKDSIKQKVTEKAAEKALELLKKIK